MHPEHAYLTWITIYQNIQYVGVSLVLRAETDSLMGSFVMAHRFRSLLLNNFYQDTANAAHVSSRSRLKSPQKAWISKVNWYTIGNIRPCFMRNRHHAVSE